MTTYKVVMVRHGESLWNKENKFCGWYDADLSENGEKEAVAAGKTLKNEGWQFDLAYTSLLKRAKRTLDMILSELGQECLEKKETWQLNERHYGALTGKNKAETAKKYGEEKVHEWRRSFNKPPPAMESDHDYYEKIAKDPRYEGVQVPSFESLELTIKRTMPYWDDVIVPSIKAGKRILIAAHGNSLRGIVKQLDKISNDDIMELNLPTGIPFYYELDEDMNPIQSMKFLGDEETVKRAMASVAAQGKAK